MKRVFLLLALVLIFCAGCIPNEGTDTVPNGAETPEEALEIAMSVLSGGESDRPVFQGANGAPVSSSGNTGLAGAISRQTSYEVKSVETADGITTALLEITAPDMTKLVREALKGMEGFDEEAFSAALEALLERNSDTKTFTVQVELTQIQGCWCVIPNAELSNAVTGGLMEEYTAVRQSILDALAKGGDGA